MRLSFVRHTRHAMELFLFILFILFTNTLEYQIILLPCVCVWNVSPKVIKKFDLNVFQRKMQIVSVFRFSTRTFFSRMH